MNTATVTIPYRSRKQIFSLYFIGDIHAGSVACDEEKLLATIEKVKLDPDARVFLMGDLCEYIPRGEWRWRESMVSEWVRKSDVASSEREKIVEWLTPIKGKILGAIQGNHELSLHDYWNQNAHQQVVSALGIKDLGYSALVRLHFQYLTGPKRIGNSQGGRYRKIDLYLHHGWGGGRTEGADLNRFSELQRDYQADIYVAGHTHRKYAIKTIRHYLDHHDNFNQKPQLICRSGTFLKTIVEGGLNYPERSAMRPLPTGCLVVMYHPEKSDFEEAGESYIEGFGQSDRGADNEDQPRPELARKTTRRSRGRAVLGGGKRVGERKSKARRKR